MANKDLNRKPHNINEDTWWYEEKGGITIIVNDTSIVRHIKISWRALRNALKRKDK